MNKLVKTLHIVFGCLWLGSAASTVVLQCLRGWSDDHRVLASLNVDLALLDATLILPGAMGSLVTGFCMCKMTSWGFMRYWWVIAKWLGMFSAILLGGALLGPWQIQMVNLSGELESAPVAGGPYDLIRLPFTLLGFLQVYLLMTVVAVSVQKPWGKRVVKLTEAMPALRRAERAA